MNRVKTVILGADTAHRFDVLFCVLCFPYFKTIYVCGPITSMIRYGDKVIRMVSTRIFASQDAQCIPPNGLPYSSISSVSIHHTSNAALSKTGFPNLILEIWTGGDSGWFKMVRCIGGQTGTHITEDVMMSCFLHTCFACNLISSEHA